MIYFDVVADLNVAPANLLEGVFLVVEAVGERVVLDGVLRVPTVVLVGILDHRGDDDEDEGWKHSGLSVRNRDHFDRLHERDKGKVDVGCF